MAMGRPSAHREARTLITRSPPRAKTPSGMALLALLALFLKGANQGGQALALSKYIYINTLLYKGAKGAKFAGCSILGPFLALFGPKEG